MASKKIFLFLLVMVCVKNLYSQDDITHPNINLNEKTPSVEAPIKLTTSGRGKLTTCFAGEDLNVQVC